MINIKNDAIGVSTKQVMDCEDIMQLKEWLTLMELHLAELTARINKLKMDYKSGDDSLYDQIHKTKTYRRFQSALKGLIANRIGQVKIKGWKHKMQIENEFWRSKIYKIDPDNFRLYQQELEDLIADQEKLKDR